MAFDESVIAHRSRRPHARSRWSLISIVCLLALIAAADAVGRGPVVGAAARIPPTGPRTYQPDVVESTSASAVQQSPTPKASVAVTVSPVFVGPLFPGGLEAAHTCSASVVASSGGNVILTAAHCLVGSGVGWVFAPGYLDGRAPYGTWTVTAAYVLPTWNSTRSPDADFAFLRVVASPGNRTNASVQSTVGGATLGVAPRAGTVVTVAAYAAGMNDSVITCTTATTDTPARGSAPVPTFTCGRYPGGTSGGPWLEQSANGPLVDGVIGGLHHGGCTDPTSYTSRFGASAASLLKRASSSAPPDHVAPAGSDGC